MIKCNSAYIRWRVSKAGARSDFSRYNCIYTVTSAYYNPLYDNSVMMSIAKLRGTNRLRTADMPVSKEASIHGSKEPKLKQTRITEWGSLLPLEPED